MRRTITPEWITAVKAAIKAAGTSQNAIAAKVGTSSAMMSLLLSGDQQTSKFAEPISAVLGIDLPLLELRDPMIEELAGIAADLDKEDVLRLLDTAKRFSSSRKSDK